MKYEAKQVSTSSTPISQASGTPWVSIDQSTAIANSQNVADCTGCHLITEPEWLTIAQNVLSVASNWTDATGTIHTVGTGYIYSGHNDNVPANTLDANTDDNNGYYGTGNVSPSNQRRTLTLTNGEVIWDLAGNVWEWTSGNITTNQPGVIGSGLAWREWTAVTNIGSISPNPSPTATGIAGASGWNSSQGVGTIYSNSDNTVLRRYFCGGSFSNVSNYTGVLALNIEHMFDTYVNVGYRVASP